MHVKRSYRFASVRRGPDPFSPSTWFGRAHPLADVARDRCRAEGHHLPRRGACGACWERAVRDDERFAVECSLPRELSGDAGVVDEVAVDRACRGEVVRLTRLELWVAVARLRDRGLTARRIASRLGRDSSVVGQVLAGLAGQEVAA